MIVYLTKVGQYDVIVPEASSVPQSGEAAFLEAARDYCNRDLG